MDIIPKISHLNGGDLAIGGRLYQTDGLTLATGGAVSNTGLSLHRLGVNVELVGHLVMTR